MKTWFTSDTHLGHANIIRYCNRPFKNVDEMNETIVKNWNERVKPEDLVYFAGDFCFRNSPGGKAGEGEVHKADYYRKQLNGDIVFIKGNHDRNNSLKTNIERVIIRYGGHKICLVHNPIHIDFSYSFNFVGHVHEKWKFKKMKFASDQTNVVNVGVDVWNFRPVNFEEIMRGFKQWTRHENVVEEKSQKQMHQNYQSEREEKTSTLENGQAST